MTQTKLESKEEMKRLLSILQNDFELKPAKDFPFEDNLDKQIWKDQIEEYLLPFLEEELEKRLTYPSKQIHFEFSCPHCNFHSRLFNRICLHLDYNKDCYLRNQVSPCYPINHCYFITKGKKYQYIP